MMKFVVLLLEDMEKYCSLEQEMWLHDICETVRRGRERDGRNGYGRYYVVNVDEPYADTVKQLIEEHEGEELTFD